MTQTSTDRKKPGEEDIDNIYRDQVAAEERADSEGSRGAAMTPCGQPELWGFLYRAHLHTGIGVKARGGGWKP